MAVVDIYDALRTRRPYKPPLDDAEALRILVEGARTGQLDPDIVRVFCEIRDEAAREEERARPLNPACLFCQIAARQSPADVEYEDDEVLAFRDLYPKAPVHLLIVPKRHIESVSDARAGRRAARRAAGPHREADRRVRWATASEGTGSRSTAGPRVASTSGTCTSTSSPAASRSGASSAAERARALDALAAFC